MLQSLASASSWQASSVVSILTHSAPCPFALSELETLERSSTTAPQQVPIMAPQQVPTTYAQQQAQANYSLLMCLVFVSSLGCLQGISGVTLGAVLLVASFSLRASA